eukprot:scaffold2557_cov121-Cylindrotheca_fusiformis.AAC.18
MPTVAQSLTDSASDSQSAKEVSIHSLDKIETMTKTERLVEWNVEVLTSLLQQIIASRGEVLVDANKNSSLKETEATIGTGDTVLEEFVPIIH